MNRRIGFFALAAVICFALVPLVADKLRWVPLTVASLYVLLTLLAVGDHLGRRNL